MDARIKDLLTRLSFFAQDGMTDKPIVEIAKQADALLTELVKQQNTQQPVAWAVLRDGEVWRVSRFEPTEMGEVGGAVLVPLVPRTAIAATQPEPVNQQLLAALEPFAKAHETWNGGNAPLHFSTAAVPAHFRRAADVYRAAIAAAEAAQPVERQAEPIGYVAPEELPAMKDGVCAFLYPHLDRYATQPVFAQQPASAQPVAVPDGLHKDMATALASIQEAQVVFSALKRAVSLLLEAKSALGPEDHELRDRIISLLSAAPKPEGV
ncbi:MAG TPA: hypothetical protein VFW49_14910 [Fluviicoccus sp.]|nr:hypothetical protein [Fluviicoccus sp.]